MIDDLNLTIYTKLSDDRPGPTFVAIFTPKNPFCIRFEGESVEDVLLSADRFRREVRDKQEATRSNRAKGAATARQSRKPKETTDG